MGQSFDLARDHKLLNWMEGAGFANIKEDPFKLPLGSWAAEQKMKNVGNYNLVTTDQGLEGYALYLFTNVLGWCSSPFLYPADGKYKRDLLTGLLSRSVEATHVFIANARKELRDKSIHTYYAG